MSTWTYILQIFRSKNNIFIRVSIIHRVTKNFLCLDVIPQKLSNFWCSIIYFLIGLSFLAWGWSWRDFNVNFINHDVNLSVNLFQIRDLNKVILFVSKSKLVHYFISVSNVERQLLVEIDVFKLFPFLFFQKF